MRFPKDQLVRMGTALLAETADECLKQRPHRGPGLRLALAMLYGLGEGPRDPFVAFWKTCGIPDVRGERARAVRQARYQAAWAAYAEILAGLDQNWPGGPEDKATQRRRQHAAARRPERPRRSGNDTRMISPVGKSCGWL